MTRPDWCPEDVWEKATRVHGNTQYDEVVARSGSLEELHAACDHDCADIARAIMTAQAEEREACLNAASSYLQAQYGFAMLSHPVDRARIAAIRATP